LMSRRMLRSGIEPIEFVAARAKTPWFCRRGNSAYAPRSRFEERHLGC
jgi:hypothetical protein